MIGKTISHYKILEKLGEGGMGVVYKAEDTKLDRTVALKFLSAQFLGSGGEKIRFIHEAKAAAALNHPNICTVYEIDESEGHSFIAMEHVAGQSLKARIESGPLELDEAIRVATQIAVGLSEAHETGIVHRDIKPANIMLTSKGQAKIMDFGLAKSPGRAQLTTTGTTVGTVAYMSPEQARGEAVDHRSDIWSLGVVLYEMLAGGLPFQGGHEQAVMYSILNEDPTPLKEVQPDVPGELERIVEKTLAKNPGERYQSANELLVDLKTLTQSTSTGTPKARIPSKERVKTRNRVLVLISALGILAASIIAVAVYTLIPFKREIPPWLQTSASLERLTSESGVEHGKISPDGRYLAYVDFGGVLTLKMLGTGETKKVGASEHIYHMQPEWSPDGTHIAVIATDFGEFQLLIYSVLGKLARRLEVPRDSFCPSWSPDGSWIAFVHEMLDSVSSLMIVKPGGTDIKEFPVGVGVACPAWSPDSRHVAFVESSKPRVNVVRILDIETGTVSNVLKGARPCAGFWYQGGLAWSPDGRYLVYVGYDGEYRELFAQRLDRERNAASGPPVPATRLHGVGAPFWPCFTKDGQRLGFGIEESNKDIYAVPIDIESAAISGKVTPVATDKRRDWDPCWMPDGKSVVFSSMRDGQADLYRFDFETAETERLTMTPAVETNAQVSPDGELLIYSSEGRLWRMSTRGGTVRRLTPDSVRVERCFAWPSDSTSLFATVVDTSRQYSSSLVHIDLSSGEQRLLVETLNSWTQDISLSPDGRSLAVSGVRVRPTDYSAEKVSLLDLASGQWRDLLTQATIIPRGRISWTPDSRFVLHDRTGLDREGWVLYEFLPADGGPPTEVNLDVGILGGDVFMDRIDPSGRKVLVTVDADQSDMWVLGGK